MKYYQGKFTPKNPDKYKGDVNNIIYRSSWEYRMMVYCDTSSNILFWNSEEIIVPYISPKDGKIHRYFLDFYVEAANGKIYIVEVKPSKQTKPPSKKSKNYLYENVTYQINQAKWKYAKKYAHDRGWLFQIMTEKELGIPKCQTSKNSKQKSNKSRNRRSTK